jgi:hypothetical protein
MLMVTRPVSGPDWRKKMELNPLRSTIYNSLPDVIIADKRLKSLDWDAVLDDLSDVILAHKLQDVFGIRLLHIHNEIGPDEIMLELEENFDGRRKCLSTVAMNMLNVSAATYPNSWMLWQGQMEPLEHSSDPEVSLSAIARQRISSFFTDFADVLRGHGAEQLLGPCVIRRRFYATKPNDRAILIEVTDNIRRANLLHFADPTEYETNNLIDATWIVRSRSANESLVKCKQRCAASSCVTHSACVVESGRHKSVTSHSKGEHVKQHYEGT